MSGALVLVPVSASETPQSSTSPSIGNVAESATERWGTRAPSGTLSNTPAVLQGGQRPTVEVEASRMEERGSVEELCRITGRCFPELPPGTIYDDSGHPVWAPPPPLGICPECGHRGLMHEFCSRCQIGIDAKLIRYLDEARVARCDVDTPSPIIHWLGRCNRCDHRGQMWHLCEICDTPRQMYGPDSDWVL